MPCAAAAATSNPGLGFRQSHLSISSCAHTRNSSTGNFSPSAPLIASKPQGPEFDKLARELEEKTGAAERNLYQTRNESQQDPLNFPIRLNNQIAALSGVAEGEYRPTAQSLEAFATLSRSADKDIGAVSTTITELVPKLNALLRAAGLNPIVPSTAEVKPPSIHP